MPGVAMMPRGGPITCLLVVLLLQHAGVPDGGILSGQSMATCPYLSQSKHHMWGQ